MTAHSYQLQPRFYELDPYGHVNHSVYVQYFESARVALLSEIGFGLDQMLVDDVQLVVIRLATRFIGAAGLHENLTIETGLVETGRVKSRWAQRVVRDDVAITTQIIDFAATNGQGRPRRMPAGLADAMARFHVEPDWLGSSHPG